MHREEVRVGVVITAVLIDVIITDIDRERAGGRRGTIQQVVDRDPDAAAGASLGLGVGAEREEGEKRHAGSTGGKERRFHDGLLF
jgi:hypothetical protein